MSGGEKVEALALDLLACGVLVADGTGRPLCANAAARAMLGLGSRGLDEVACSCQGRRVSLAHLVRDHAAGPAFRRRLELEGSERRPLRATLTRLDADGRAPWVHVVVERACRRDWRWARSSDPLAAFAHEVRNALTSLIEGLALLAEEAAGPVAEPQRRLLEGMDHDAQRMSRLTENMIAASRMRAGSVRLAARKADAGALARETVRSFEAAATRAGVALELESTAPDAVCYADPDLLAQALSNLVGNALKATPRGGAVRLSVRHAALEGEAAVEIAVRDTGPGLAPDEIERLLGKEAAVEPERGDEPRASSAPRGAAAGASGSRGLGIGLAITREIVELHGGRLEANGEPGAGTCFRIVVPSDLRRGERWRLAQIADSLRLARAVDAPLAVVEVGLLAPDGRGGPCSAPLGLSLLSLIEQCLAESLRPSDAVAAGDRSITVVLHDVDRPGARRVAERVLGSLSQLLDGFPTFPPGCRIGFGVASYPEDGETAEEVVAAARRAMDDSDAWPAFPRDERVEGPGDDRASWVDDEPLASVQKEDTQG